MSKTRVMGGVVLVLSGIVNAKLVGNGPRGGNVAINSQLLDKEKKMKSTC